MEAPVKVLGWLLTLIWCVARLLEVGAGIWALVTAAGGGDRARSDTGRGEGATLAAPRRRKEHIPAL